MKLLKALVEEYKEKFVHEEIFDDSASGEIKRVQKALLDEKFLPSIQLKQLFKKLLRRSKYPMEVAIVGQFSSGKSTFLNALLSKDVLPTGVTPVTSKVNYINYGDEYKLKVSYNNGVDEYHALEAISKFTDQRKAVEDVKYLTLYAPMDILKEISFVDTPGLNSQSLSDTQATRKILRDVDGIIWLTLLDNAGKQSESEVLSEYLENFKDKSLCVLNQKDKFTQEQVNTTVSYVKEKFGAFFCEVIPISAKQALDSRVNQKEVLIETALHSMRQAFKESSQCHKDASDLSFFKNDFENFTNEMKSINQKDVSNDEKIMAESNISEVLKYIEENIRPQAKASKIYAIKKDLGSVCDILIKEYETILGVYESLQNILVEKENEILKAFDSVYLKHSKTLRLTYDKIESIMQMIADTIYENVISKEATRYKEEKNVFNKSRFVSQTYETLFVDGEAIAQKLFYENQLVDKQVKAAMSQLKSIQLQSSEDFRGVYHILQNAVHSWQEPYELIKKHREIASDLEFANTRQFVAKAYENILLDYHGSILGNIGALGKKYAFFNGAFTYSFAQTTQDSVFLVKEKIDKQIKAFESDPTKYSVGAPSSDEILELVKNNFKFEKMESFLTSRRNYLYKTVETSKERFAQINREKIAYVISKKQIFIDKIDEIKDIKNNC